MAGLVQACPGHPCLKPQKNRDRGKPRDSALPHHRRVRTRRFGGLSDTSAVQGCEAERGKEGIRKSPGERGAGAKPPRDPKAAGSFRRRHLADAATSPRTALLRTKAIYLDDRALAGARRPEARTSNGGI